MTKKQYKSLTYLFANEYTNNRQQLANCKYAANRITMQTLTGDFDFEITVIFVA